MATEMLIKLHARMEEQRMTTGHRSRTVPVHLRLVPEPVLAPREKVPPAPQTPAPLAERSSEVTEAPSACDHAVQAALVPAAHAPGLLPSVLRRAEPRQRSAPFQAAGVSWQSAPHAALRRRVRPRPIQEAMALLGPRLLAWVQVDPFVQRLERLH